MNSNSETDTHNLELEMIKLRYWQHLMNEDLKKKLFNIPIHVALGNEAVTTAVSHMMKEDDQLALTHRNMSYNLARARGLKPVYDEYKLSPDGIAGGKLGSMNQTNPARGIVYSSSILGNNFSVACGLALAKQVKVDPGIVIVATGDGAMEEGGFYEALVLSKSQNLKLMIIVENNNHSMSSTIKQRRCNIGVDKMCEAVDITYKNLSGNDVFEYTQELTKLRHEIEERSAPVCVEANLTLMNQHAGPTPGWDTDPMNADLKNGLVVRNTDEDPLYVLREKMGEQAFEKMADQVMSEKWN
jgi:TPP-dependent pyruvate/acetoin dehydrogenase alpha subunit